MEKEKRMRDEEDGENTPSSSSCTDCQKKAFDSVLQNEYGIEQPILPEAVTLTPVATGGGGRTAEEIAAELALEKSKSKMVESKNLELEKQNREMKMRLSEFAKQVSLPFFPILIRIFEHLI